MKSPFPGMDPYLEPHWLDVHSALVVGARRALNVVLPEDLVASVEERVAVESEGKADRIIGSDVRVFETTPPGPGPTAAVVEAGVATSTMIRLVAHLDPIVERFVRIVEAGSERLISVIEFVSPTNKRGAGVRAFRKNRGRLLAAGVSVVTVDLVRSGNWGALLRPHAVPGRGVTAYRATVHLPGEDDDDVVDLYPIGLRDRLPTINVPLRKGESPAPLALQALVDEAYAEGRYGRRLKYADPPRPKLEPADAAWADELLKAAGRR